MFGLPLDPILLVPFMASRHFGERDAGCRCGFRVGVGSARGQAPRHRGRSGDLSGQSVAHCVLAAMGVAAMLHSHVWAYDALRYLGAVYLAVLAWRAWVGAGAPLSARGATGMRRAVTQGFVTNILNPKSGVVYFGVPAAVYQSCGGSGLATDAAAWGAVYLYGSGCHNRLRGAGGISIDASSTSRKKT